MIHGAPALVLAQHLGRNLRFKGSPLCDRPRSRACARVIWADRFLARRLSGDPICGRQPVKSKESFSSHSVVPVSRIDSALAERTSVPKTFSSDSTSLRRTSNEEAEPFSHAHMVLRCSREKVALAGLAAEAQAPMMMRYKAEFSSTICAAVLEQMHGIPSPTEIACSVR
jgi:hypothetical protein